MGLSRCLMCLEEEETADDLLIRCCWASYLWHLSLSLMGVSWVQPSLVKDMGMWWWLGEEDEE